MKKLYLFFTVGLGILLLTSSVFSTSLNGRKPLANSPIPENLQLVFKNSCMICHASGGKGMAMSKLNFSNWDKYDSAKQAEKATAICNILSKGKMPPKSYIKAHPDAIPTASQIDEICKWSAIIATKK